MRSAPVLVLAFAAFLSLVATLEASENPAGLPEPIDSARPGSVILHGGGEVSDAVRDRFLALAGGKQARIVLIPSGTYVQGIAGIAGREFAESDAEYRARLEREFAPWFALRDQKQIADFQLLYTDNQTDMDRPEFVASLKRATGVWIPARFQGKLAWRFAPRYVGKDRTSLFQSELEQVVARGGVVAGIGGGMSALVEIMSMGDNGASGQVAFPTLRAGLGLVRGAIVEQHFDDRGSRLERFTSLLRNDAELERRSSPLIAARDIIGLAADSQTALVIRGKRVEALGKALGHVFTKSNGGRTITWRTLADGESCSLAVSEIAPPQRARALANPFGMPTPDPGCRSGVVVLHGGRSSAGMIEVFPTLSGVPRPNFVHCPAARSKWRPAEGETSAELLARLKSDLSEWPEMQRKGKLGELSFLSTADARDARRATFVKPLESAHAVWFSGGDQSVLGDLFVDRDRPTLFQRALLDVLRRGGVVGGTSAGTAVMAKVMTVSDTSAEGAPPRAEIAHGFGVLSNVILEQHFGGRNRGGRIERFSGLLRDNARLRRFLGDDPTKPEEMIGLCVEESTALVLQENRLKVTGSQGAHVFLKSRDQKTIAWHVLETGESARLVAGDAGPLLVAD